MKKLQIVLLCLLAAILLAGTALADIVSGPAYALVLGVPVFAIVVIVLIAVLVIRSVVRAARQNKTVEKPGDEMRCRHEDAESHARKSSWDNRDPWD